MKYIVAVFALLGALLLLHPLPAHAAYDLFDAKGQGVDCSKPQYQNSAVCTSSTTENPLTGPDGLILQIADIVAFIAGAAAIIVIIVGGIRFITSGGDSNKVATARNAVLYSVIGLAVIILSRTLVVYVVKQL